MHILCSSRIRGKEDAEHTEVRKEKTREARAERERGEGGGRGGGRESKAKKTGQQMLAAWCSKEKEKMTQGVITHPA